MITMMVNQGVQFAAVELEYLHTLVLAFRRSEDAHVWCDAIGFEEHTDEALDAQRLVALNVIDSAWNVLVYSFLYNQWYFVNIKILTYLLTRGERKLLAFSYCIQHVWYEPILVFIFTIDCRQDEMKKRHYAGG